MTVRRTGQCSTPSGGRENLATLRSEVVAATEPSEDNYTLRGVVFGTSLFNFIITLAVSCPWMIATPHACQLLNK